jgi:hypothetical protein
VTMTANAAHQCCPAPPHLCHDDNGQRRPPTPPCAPHLCHDNNAAPHCLCCNDDGQCCPTPPTSSAMTTMASTAHQHQLLESPTKKMKSLHINNQLDTPIGLRWDNNDWSCLYDSLFVILNDIWNQVQRSGIEDSKRLEMITLLLWEMVLCNLCKAIYYMI